MFFFFYVLQAAKLSLHQIEGHSAETLPVLTPAELEAIADPNKIINKMSTLEIQCGQMKPNLGAISEYKKKVCMQHSDILLIFAE